MRAGASAGTHAARFTFHPLRPGPRIPVVTRATGGTSPIARRKASGSKSPPDKSDKFHVDNPPKEIKPKLDLPEHPRGQDGQFTGKGNPGRMQP